MKIIVEYWTAPWCGPCQAFKPSWQIIKDHFKNDTRVIFNERDYDSNKAEYDKLGISGIPKLVFWQVEQGQLEPKYLESGDTKSSQHTTAYINGLLNGVQLAPTETLFGNVQPKRNWLPWAIGLTALFIYIKNKNE